MKLEITDLSKFKITKLKPWAIYFTYDNIKYLLHEYSDDDSNIVLYKRIQLNNSGKYKLEPISYSWSDIPEITYKLKYIRSNKGRTHNQINIEKLVYTLTEMGLFSGIYYQEIVKKNDPIYRKKQEIEKLQREIDILESFRRNAK